MSDPTSPSAASTALVAATADVHLQELALALHRVAALHGQAVTAERFLQGLPGTATANDTASALQAMWRHCFPDGAVRGLDAEGVRHAVPVLWLAPPPAQPVIVKGVSGDGLLVCETLDGQLARVTPADLQHGAFVALDTHAGAAAAGSATAAAGSAAPSPSATEVFREALWKRRSVFAEGALATLVANVFGLVTALYTMQVYDRVVPNQGYATLWVLTIGVVLSIGLELLMRQLRARHVERACKAIDEELSDRFFDQALAVRMEHRPRQVGTFASQVRQFESVRGFLSSATLFVIADVPFALFFVAVIALIAGPLALIPLLFIPVALLTGLAFQKPIQKHMAVSVEESNRKNGLLFESMSAIESIKAAGAEWKVRSLWNGLTHSTAQRELVMRDLSSLSGSLTQTLQQLSYVALIAVGALAIGSGYLTVGGLIACSIISGRALAPIAQIAGFVVQWQHTKVALQTLDRIMALPRDSHPGQRAIVPRECLGRLTLEDLKFGYEQRAVLAVPRLDIQPGERVAVLGTVGSGKSTLIKLLSGLYAPAEGRVMVDGVDARQVAHGFLRQHIGYLPQDVRLFQGSLRENLTLGLPVQSDEHILACARLTGLDRVIQAHPMGLERDIAEGGMGLSGGQRQLVGITRLLLGGHRIMLMDEPTASMDLQLERRFEQEVLSSLASNTTLIVATHKPAILGQFDRIIVVDKGTIVADGPRDKILARLSPQPKPKLAGTAGDAPLAA